MNKFKKQFSSFFSIVDGHLTCPTPKNEKSSYPWVMRFSVKWRPNWFSWFWTTRGSNFRDLQIGPLVFGFGRPWLNTVLQANLRDYRTLEYVQRSNETFFNGERKSWRKLIGKYEDFDELAFAKSIGIEEIIRHINISREEFKLIQSIDDAEDVKVYIDRIYNINRKSIVNVDIVAESTLQPRMMVLISLNDTRENSRYDANGYMPHPLDCGKSIMMHLEDTEIKELQNMGINIVHETNADDRK